MISTKLYTKLFQIIKHMTFLVSFSKSVSMIKD